MERCQDPLGLGLGRTETRGRVRGIGYGAALKDYLPDSPEPAKMRRCSKESSKCAFNEEVEEAVPRKLVSGGLEQGLSPLHPCTPSPYDAVQQISSTPIEGCTHGSPCPINDITISVVGSTNHWNSTGSAY